VKLSILIPVYNERVMVERSLAQVLAAPLPENMERELIIVDDCSTDGTWPILQRLAAREPAIRLLRHEVNQGKGAAVRTAIQHATGDFSLVQDADLEYDPSEYPHLLRPLLDGRADAVFGSRYLAGKQRRFDGMADEHDHVRCVRCGRIDDVPASPTGDAAERIRENLGYDIIGRRLEFMGVCPKCRRERTRRAHGGR